MRQVRMQFQRCAFRMESANSLKMHNAMHHALCWSLIDFGSAARAVAFQCCVCCCGRTMLTSCIVLQCCDPDAISSGTAPPETMWTHVHVVNIPSLL